MLTLSSFPLEFILLPYLIAVLQNAQFIIVIALSFIMRLILWLALGSVLQKHPGRSLTDIIHDKYGNIIGFVVRFIQFLYLLFIQVALLVGILKVIKSYFLINTPNYIILFFICLASLYGMSKGLSDIGRMSKGFCLILPIFLVFFMGSAFSIDVTNYFPLFENDVLGIFYVAYVVLSIFNGFEVAGIYSKYLDSSVKLLKTGYLSICCTHLVYLVACLCAFGVLGNELIVSGGWTLISLNTILVSPIINRPEVIFCFFQLLLSYMLLNIYGFGNLEVMFQAYAIENKKIKLIISGGYSLTLYGLVLYLSQSKTFIDLMYVKQYYLIVLIFILFICAIVPSFKLSRREQIG